MCHQSRAENAGCFGLHIVDGFHNLDAAGFAAAAGMNLGFHHPNRTAQFLGALDRFIDGEGGHAARHRDAEFLQYGFRLILVNIHSAVPARC